MKKIQGITIAGFDKELEKFGKEIQSGNFDLKKFLKDYQETHKRYLEMKRRKRNNLLKVR
ncbi:hypothetical protein ES705_33084 [subsurface metagenome]|nr:MAG: hypothetical protein ES695_16215 [Candidatus Atribacteria bacterium 1244-E10-H5-B2]